MKKQRKMRGYGALITVLALVLAPMAPAALAAEGVTATLAYTKAGGDPVVPGDTLTFTAVFQNSTGAKLEDCALSVPIDPAFTYVPGSIEIDGVSKTDASGDDEAAYGAGEVTAALGDVTDGASVQVVFQAVVEEDAAGLVSLTGEFSYEQGGEPLTKSAAAEVKILRDGIGLTLQATAAMFLPGTGGVLMLSAKNEDDVGISDITLTLNLPAVFIPGSCTLTSGGVTKAIVPTQKGSVYSFVVGSVAAGKTASLNVGFSVNLLAPSGLYRCDAGIRYWEFTGKATATASVAVLPSTPAPTPPPPGPTPPPKKDIADLPDLFTDDAGHWAEAFINVLAARGAMNGMGEGVFEPETGLTRAMVVQALYKLYGAGEIVAGGSFTDLSADWYKNAVNWAAKHGIVNGVSETEFGPDRPATREQAVVILDRLVTQRGKMILPAMAKKAFVDEGSISEFALEAVYRFQRGGIVAGNENGDFNPAGTIKRAEYAKILCLYLDSLDELGYDVSSLK